MGYRKAVSRNDGHHCLPEKEKEATAGQEASELDFAAACCVPQKLRSNLLPMRGGAAWWWVAGYLTTIKGGSNSNKVEKHCFKGFYLWCDFILYLSDPSIHMGRHFCAHEKD